MVFCQKEFVELVFMMNRNLRLVGAAGAFVLFIQSGQEQFLAHGNSGMLLAPVGNSGLNGNKLTR